MPNKAVFRNWKSLKKEKFIIKSSEQDVENCRCWIYTIIHPISYLQYIAGEFRNYIATKRNEQPYLTFFYCDAY